MQLCRDLLLILKMSKLSKSVRRMESLEKCSQGEFGYLRQHQQQWNQPWASQQVTKHGLHTNNARWLSSWGILNATNVQNPSRLAQWITISWRIWIFSPWVVYWPPFATINDFAVESAGNIMQDIFWPSLYERTRNPTNHLLYTRQRNLPQRHCSALDWARHEPRWHKLKHYESPLVCEQHPICSESIAEVKA